MGQIYNTKEDLLNALKRVIKNNQKATTSEKIRTNDEDIVETLWEKVVQNTLSGTQDPNGNVTADEIGRFYVRIDTNPKQLWYALEANNSSWVRLDNEIESGNGISVNVNEISLGDFTGNVTLSAGDFNYILDRLNTWEIISQSDPVDANGTNSIKTSRGYSELRSVEGSNTSFAKTTPTSSLIYSENGTASAQVEVNNLGQIFTISSDGTDSRTVVESAGEATINTTKLKGDKYGAENTNLNWEIDNRYIPDVGTIRNNTKLIRGYENITTAHGAISSDTYVTDSINIKDNVGKYFKYSYTSNPSTDVYIKTYEIDLLTTDIIDGSYFFLEFINNYSGAKINVDGVFQFYLSQNAKYFVHWDGSEFKFEMLGSPKPVYLRGGGHSITTPGVYYYFSGASITLPSVDNCLSEDIKIYTSASVSTSSSSTIINENYGGEKNVVISKMTHAHNIGDFWYVTPS